MMDTSKTKTYAYYPGCSAHGTASDYDQAVRAVFDKLGLKLEDMKDWVCCGATPVHAMNPDLAYALSAKNLEIAEKMEKDVAVACAACFNRMKTTVKHLGHDEELRKKINKIASTEIKANIEVYHILSILSKIPSEELEKAMTKKLTGLKVGCYYGCLLVRPPKVTEFDDPENPTVMEKILEHTGAEMVDWNFKTECCGASLSVPKTGIVIKLCHDILDDAKKRGIDVLSVACPLCQMNLDMRQWEVEAKYKTRYRIPIMYFAQVLGIAMDIPAYQLGLAKMIVSPLDILREKKILMHF